MGPQVALEVRLPSDPSAAAVARASVREAGADGGFGLQLVDRMADRWWIERDAGTPVVCELRRR